MLESALEEDRAPAPAVVAPELEVVLLARHASDDVTDAAPRVEAVVKGTQLALARLKAQKAESGAEEAGAGASVALSRPNASQRSGRA